SGVREREFGFSATEIFPAESESGAALPIDFMLQVAFTSAPDFREARPDESETNDANRSDEHPWEFPTVRQRIHSIVLERVAEDPGTKRLLADSAEFVFLQRFFRLAFSGKLGQDFPIEKLEGLMAATATAATGTPSRTPRWNVRPAQQELRLGATLNAQ